MPAPTARYQISVLDGRYGLFAIRVFDVERDREFVCWQGAVARHLIRSGALPADKPRQFFAGKSVVWHLVVAAAAFALMEDRETPKGLARRLEELGIDLTQAEYQLARLLFEHPGQHLSRDDIQCLFSLRFPATAERVPALLDRLADRHVIQKIQIDPQNVFFDLETRTHAHVFDRRSRRLYDAPSSGVLQTG